MGLSAFSRQPESSTACAVVRISKVRVTNFRSAQNKTSKGSPSSSSPSTQQQQDCRRKPFIVIPSGARSHRWDFSMASTAHHDQEEGAGGGGTEEDVGLQGFPPSTLIITAGWKIKQLRLCFFFPKLISCHRILVILFAFLPQMKSEVLQKELIYDQITI